MKRHLMSWGVLGAVAVGLALPATADRGGRWKDDRQESTRIVIKQENDPEDARLYEQWYQAQSGRFQDLDEQTGLKQGELLLLVTEVASGKFLVRDRKGVTKAVFMTKRTTVDVTDARQTRSRRDAPMPVRTGDLVMVQGCLLADGGMVAQRVQLMGSAWSGAGEQATTYTGYRGWGEVRRVDVRNGRIEVLTGAGTRILLLTPRAELVMDGRQIALPSIRPGDRIVYYATREGYASVEVTRVAVLGPRDNFPDEDRPYATDPCTTQPGDAGDRDANPMVEGYLNSLSTGLLFTKMVLTSTQARLYTIRIAPAMQAIDQDGNIVPISELRHREHLRVRYTLVGGSFFATRIEVR